MLQVLREFFWAMRARSGRFELLFSLVRFCPGQYGWTIRARLLRRHLAAAGDHLHVLVGVMIRNPEKMSVGHHVGIGDFVLIQAGGGLELGDYVMLGPGVKIWTQNHRVDDPDVPVRDQGYDSHKVVIGEDVWIGANAFIMPGVCLPRGCVVSAGSVVGRRQYKEYSIIAGNPARVIGFRGGKTPPSPPSQADGTDESA